MDGEFKKPHKRYIIIAIVSLLTVAICVSAFFLFAWENDYEYGIESYYLTDSSDLYTANVDIYVKNKSSEKQRYYVRLRVYKQDDDSLVGGGSAHIIVAANSELTYTIVVTAYSSYKDLSGTYVKIKNFMKN